MKKYDINDFKKGWLVGDFEPSLIKTKEFEFGVKFFKKGDFDQAHFHKIAEEITVIISGVFNMNEKKLHPGDVVLISKNETVSFYCIEDGGIAVIKKPSVIGDKFIIN